MRIAEIYSSLQGEGQLTGVPSILVRTSGCNLRCWFCDTPFTSWRPEGVDRDVAEIVAQVDALRNAGGSWLSTWQRMQSSGEVPSIEHAIITGGEPMLHAELLPLTEQLRARGFHITIETAGTLYLPVVCDLMSISPKLANSTPNADRAGSWTQRHERDRIQPAVIRRLLNEHDCQLKFVIDTPADCAEFETWLRDFAPLSPDRVWLMPQGIDADKLATTSRWLRVYCDEHGYQFCPRRHVEWFGVGRGT